MILIEGGALVAATGGVLREAEGYVAFDRDAIVASGAGQAPEPLRSAAARVIDARHMAVLPGLVNGHTHLSQTFLRGLADGRGMLRWLKEVIWPAQAAMTPDDLYLAAKLGLAENLLCGAATVVQHHKLPGNAYLDAVARAASELGVRLVLARGWVDLGAAGEPLDTILRDMAWLHETWHGPCAGTPVAERIRVAFGPMAPWRCSDQAMRETAALARAWNVATHIHAAETQDEIDLMRQRCGKGDPEWGHIQWLADLGCLDERSQLVHCVHVSPAELDLIAASGATVVYCPTSNMYLASGAAPVRDMLARGIPVSLGADGSGSNHSQDMLECAKIAALLAKHASGNPEAVVPADIIAMLTSAGARQWRLTTAPGDPFAAGQPADLTLVDLDNPRCQPVHSAASALVYNASGADVHTVIVGGDILVEGGSLMNLDEKMLLEECRVAARTLLARAGIAA